MVLRSHSQSDHLTEENEEFHELQSQEVVQILVHSTENFDLVVLPKKFVRLIKKLCSFWEVKMWLPVAILICLPYG